MHLSDPLNNDTLGQLAARLKAPTYNRNRLRHSIVHIGVGGFHRAHLATHIHQLCEAGYTDWAIVGSGVLRGDAPMAQALKAQDGLYTLSLRGPRSDSIEIIGSIVDYIHAWPDPLPLINQIAAPATQIVSLTVTEGGYPIDDATGEFLPESPNASPDSAFTILARALELRHRAGGAPLTLMSCDNIMANGRATKTAVLGAAAQFGPALTQWIEESVTFPNSMVDRITPATTDSDRHRLQELHSVSDLCPVAAEPFWQWVVEDNFAGDRLPLEELDVIVTDDVEPYEHVKLRLLNASHSCLAYLAALDGCESVADAMGQTHIAEFVRAFLKLEAEPVAPTPEGIDLNSYSDQLVERFANPNVGDQVARLCLDGSAKFPKFLLPTVHSQLTAGGPIALSALALAGWCHYLAGKRCDGQRIELAPDPKLAEAVAHATNSIDNPAAFLEFSPVFDTTVAASPEFRTAFTDALQTLRQHGVRRAIGSAIVAASADA